MRIHWLQHVPFEGLGRIADWAAESGCPVSASRMFAGDALPSVSAFDLLIVMGGPMSANDGHVHAWLDGEKRFIAQALDAGKRVLGICLGAQLIASCAGARIRPNDYKEIGWFPVERTGAAARTAAGQVLAEKTLAFHWHGETFDIPDGATHLARSRACENQAFAIGDRIVGLQYHLETTASSAAALIDHCRHELIEAPYIHSESEIRAQFVNFPALQDGMNRLLDYFQSIN
jgi:GMP synthase-like glutamine amidotransferase